MEIVALNPVYCRDVSANSYISKTDMLMPGITRVVELISLQMSCLFVMGIPGIEDANT